MLWFLEVVKVCQLFSWNFHFAPNEPFSHDKPWDKGLPITFIFFHIHTCKVKGVFLLPLIASLFSSHFFKGTIRIFRQIFELWADVALSYLTLCNGCQMRAGDKTTWNLTYRAILKHSDTITVQFLLSYDVIIIAIQSPIPSARYWQQSSECLHFRQFNW